MRDKDWTRRSVLGGAVASAAVGFSNASLAAAGPPYASFDDLLKRMPIDQRGIEAAEAAYPSFADFPRWRHLPEVGLAEKSYVIPGGGTHGAFPLPAGIDGSSITVTIAPDGSRTRINCRDVRPRINAYGNSFTHCDQVNDGETWEEYLAGHLLEPIGNFGRGGGSVYEAYRRMCYEENTSHDAKNIIFYVWGDDHLRTIANRSLMLLVFGRGPGPYSTSTPHVYFDLKKDSFVEAEGFLPSKQSLARLKDRAWIAKTVRDDLAAQLFLYGGYGPKRAAAGVIRSVDAARVRKLAAALGVPLKGSPATVTPEQAAHVVDVYGLESTKFTLEKVRAFVRSKGKNLLVVAFDPFRSFPELIKDGTRWDQSVIDYLDMTRVQFQDFKRQELGYDEYCKRYFVDGFGHYNGVGNNMFAYAIKPQVVAMLDPKPAPYLGAGNRNQDDYLYNGRGGQKK